MFFGGVEILFADNLSRYARVACKLDSLRCRFAGDDEAKIDIELAARGIVQQVFESRTAATNQDCDFEWLRHVLLNLQLCAKHATRAESPNS